MKYIKIKTDYGYDETYERWNGNFLDKNSYDEVITIYLKAPVEVLTNRLFKEKSHRPLIAHLENKVSLNDFIRKHLFERTYYYNQSSLIVAVDEKSIHEIVEEIIMKLF